MELTQFLKIVRRSWLLVLIPPLAALVLSLLRLDVPPPSYGLIAKIAVTQAGIAPSDSSFPDFNSYHSWAASEYIADDLPEIVASAAFAADLQAWLKQERGIDVPVPDLQTGLEADRVHRVLNVHISAPTPEAAQAIAEGIAALLQEKGLAYWNRQQDGGLTVRLLETPPAAPANRWRQPLWSLILRVILALAVGLILAFLRYYFDAIVRDEEDLEALGLKVISAIPPEPKASSRP